MSIPLRLLFAAAAAMLLLAAATGGAQPAWPAGPVRLVVPFPPGGGTDMVARALGDTLAQQLGRPAVIDNKPGASTIIGTDAVAKAAPDGHTLLVSGSTTYTVNPALRRKLPYDAGRDLAPLGLIAKAPLALVVRSDAPWTRLGDLVAAAKAKPGGISYASFGPGSAPQLAAGMLGLAAGIEMLEVPYKGGAAALNDLLGGQVQVAIDTVAAAAPHVKAGKLRALAVIGSVRSTMLPEVPTVAELKLPEAVFDAWYAVAAPGRIEPALRQRIERELKTALADPALQARIRAQGMEPVFVPGDTLRPLIDAEVSRYRMLAHRAKIVVD